MRAVVLASVAVCCAACGARDGDNARATVRDSAGIRIVEIHAAEWEEGEAWQVDPSPVLSIGAVQGDDVAYLFDGVSSGFLLGDYVVVADNGGREIRWFDRSGAHVRSAGGPGGGPGEFEYLGRIYRFRGDSILAVDPTKPGAAVFTPDGVYARQQEAAQVRGRTGSVRGVVADSMLLLTASVRGRFAGGGDMMRRDTIALAVAGGADTATVLGTYPSQEQYWDLTPSGGFAVWPRPFGRNTHYAVAGDNVYVGVSDRNEILAYDAGGELRAIIRHPASPLAIGGEEIDRFRQNADETAESEDQRVLRARAYADISFPSSAPAFDAFVTDDAGHLWVRAYRPEWEQGPQQWRVFAPDGAWLGDVGIPAGSRVLDIGPEHVLAVVQDELDTERVVLYRLRKGS